MNMRVGVELSLLAQVRDVRSQYALVHQDATAKLHTHKDRLHQRTPQAIAKKMRDGATQLEAASQNTAARGKAGQLPLPQFVSQYMDERKQYHKALILKERLENPSYG